MDDQSALPRLLTGGLTYASYIFSEFTTLPCHSEDTDQTARRATASYTSFILKFKQTNINLKTELPQGRLRQYP